jgi:hypothetical protein
MATTLIAKIAARAKQIRATNPKMTWQSALKKAGAEFKGTTVKTTSKRRTTTTKRKSTTKQKSKVGDPVYNAYKRAPLNVKKIIDQLGDEPDYNDLKRAAAALEKKGYFMDYGLDAQITVLRPIKKKTKKVGEPYYYGEGKRVFAGSLKVGQKYEWIIGAEYLEVKYIGKSKDFPKIKAGSTFGSGGYLFQFNDGGFANLSSPAVYQNLRTVVGSVGKSKVKQPVSKHKDTKSHNVNIRVMSGTKTPKIQKAAVNMDALNGVIKFAAGKFYEVVAGANKGSVVKITSIRRPTNKKEGSMLYTSYNVDFYEKRNGVLQKPFKGSLTDRWLNKRSIRPRLAVKTNEYKKFI